MILVAPVGAAADLAPPRVEEVVPPPGSVLTGLAFIRVVFTESVTGVDAGDLRINGLPAAELEPISPREYTFRFQEPPPGPVQVTWAPEHGITDLAPEANPLVASGWSYRIDPNLPLPRVILSEFLADNDHGIRDEDGERSDWIELRNLEATAVDLADWSLSDDPARPDRWRFPGITLPAGGYLLVWASGKDRRQPGRPLHTDFQLAREGEFLGLFDPAGNPVSAFAPAYPPQYDDISYGRDLLEPEVTGYFPTPTPGRPNVPGGPGFAGEVRADPPPGLYPTNRLEVRLSAEAGEIRYTLDGTEPTERSPLYTGPLSIVSGTVVRARVFEPGLLPGPLLAAGYVLAPPELEGFDSNLPLLIIQPATPSIPQDRRVAAWVIAVDTFRGRAALLGRPSHQSLGSIEIRGQSSTGFPKKQYNLELNDPAGLDLEAPLLGLPEESDWVLNGPYTDKSLLNNVLAFELHEKMGHYAVRRRFCEVFIDQTRAQLNTRVDYRGIYVLLEKIKIDRHRVDLARLGPETTAEPDITGGYLFKKDKDSPGDRDFSTRGGAGFGAQRLKFHDPKPDEITPAQQQWLRNHLIAFEEALYAPDWLTRTGERRYTHYIDVASFVDNHWIVEFSKQIDGYRLSNYFSKDRGGPIRMEPIWDWNLSFGNANYLEGERPEGWYWPLINADQHIWLRRLITGAPSPAGRQGDPDFNQAIADRWSVLRTNVLAASNVLARIDELAALLAEAVPREFTRWPRLDTYVWPNPPIYIQPTWEQIIANKKTWIQQRFDWIDAQFLPAPTLSRQGGPIPAGFRLAMEAPSGVIYYRLDGRDPRAAGGGVEPGTWLYRRPFALTHNARVVARARSGSEWSGPAAATFVTGRPPLRFAEIMYHPAPPPAGSPWADEEFEFIELVNAGADPFLLDGCSLQGGVTFRFASDANHWLAPGERVVVAANPEAFRERHGPTVAVLGPWTGRLANAGGTLRLIGPVEELIQETRYDGGDHPAADGVGFALTPVAGDLAAAPWETDETFWTSGHVWLGTPGLPQPPAPELPPVVVNEVLARPLPGQREAIELFNPGPAPADVSGWFLSDDPRTPKYRLPEGSVIRPGGFLVVDDTQFAPGTNQPWEFRLGDDGDEAFLFSADPDGRLTGRVHGLRYGPSPAGMSQGRHVDANGREHTALQSRATLGGPNAGPFVGPVVISEIMYHPPDVPANGRLWDAPENEYLELRNLADESVPLHDPAAPDRTWALRGGVRFTFPPGVNLAPGERVLVVGFDPRSEPAQHRAFRELYGVPAATRLFGPWEGRLDNGGEAIELVRPDLPPAAGEPPLANPILVDRVRYEDRAPWPAGADGVGPSLQRRPEDAFADDPAAWIAANPTPGGPPAAGSLPRILRQPVSAVVAAGHPFAFEVEAVGLGAIRHQWRRNGENLPGATGDRLVFPQATPANTGRYSAIVRDDTGAVESAEALLTVVPLEQDGDADGMTDLYELTHGLDPRDPYDGADDPDADGWDNFAEFLAGTDPRDGGSRLRFDRIEPGQRVTLHFHGGFQRAYRVEFRDRLDAGAWQPLVTMPAVDPGDLRQRPMAITDPTPIRPGAMRFYRLVVAEQE